MSGQTLGQSISDQEAFALEQLRQKIGQDRMAILWGNDQTIARITQGSNIVFEGSAAEFRDCFFDNACFDNVKKWAESNGFTIYLYHRLPWEKVSMRIHVSSRIVVNDLISGLRGKVAVISVTDPGQSIVDVDTSIVLRLQFHDLNVILPELTQMTYFNAEIAREIAIFVNVYKNVEHMVIHCEAGLSRSPAIAAAISEHLKITHSFFTTHMPNTMVFSILRTTLGFQQ